MADLPLICPAREELQALLQKSLDFEEEIMPTLFDSQHGKREHEQEFWKLADQERIFCWVDKGTLLNGKETWEQVLEALKTTTEWQVQVATK